MPYPLHRLRSGDQFESMLTAAVAIALQVGRIRLMMPVYPLEVKLDSYTVLGMEMVVHTDDREITVTVEWSMLDHCWDEKASRYHLPEWAIQPLLNDEHTKIEQQHTRQERERIALQHDIDIREYNRLRTLLFPDGTPE